MHGGHVRGRAEKAPDAYGQGGYLFSSSREDEFIVRASSHGIRRENEEVDLSVFIQEGGPVETEVGRQKSTRD